MILQHLCNLVPQIEVEKNAVYNLHNNTHEKITRFWLVESSAVQV